jgi:two-component system OmpR family sensor kinase
LNRYEKRSWLSFVALYLVSTFVLIGLGSWWYYSGQLKSLDSLLQYSMRHITDDLGSRVIHAHMQGSTFEMPAYEATYSVALLDADGHIVYGTLPDVKSPIREGFYREGTFRLLVSTAPNDHLGIRYAVVGTDRLAEQASGLRRTVLGYTLAALLFVTAVGVVLSHLFLGPIRTKVETVEQFIKDVTHELNTPITALRMSSQRVVQKGECDTRTLRNISASTKQLYDIYSALAYVNFSRPEEAPQEIDLAGSVAESVAYFKELAESKAIRFAVETEPTSLRIAPHRASMLINNLLSNAIKYSPRGSTVTVLLRHGTLLIRDEGIGIAPEKLPFIFERFNRGTEYAGGFGLGLSIVKSICDDAGITLRVSSEPEHGTSVALFFGER